jgi:hypothetical protein
MMPRAATTVQTLESPIGLAHRGSEPAHNLVVLRWASNKRLSADPAHLGSVQGLSGWHVLFLSVGSLLRGAG